MSATEPLAFAAEYEKQRKTEEQGRLAVVLRWNRNALEMLILHHRPSSVVIGD